MNILEKQMLDFHSQSRWMKGLVGFGLGSSGRGLAAGLALGVWLGVVPLAARAGTIYVRTTGADTNDGRSWGAAKKTVGAGLATAVSGDQVWVAGGTYVENVTLKSGVALYGGFAGSETDLSQRNWVGNRTVIDGNAAGVTVIVPSGTTPSTRIDGFTICNGGREGVQCGGSAVISNNTITANKNSGGVRCSNPGGSTVTICNNVITENISSANGGGIYCAASSSSTTAIFNNTIMGNTATGNGGGIWCSAPATISNNTIAGNVSQSDGGAIYISGSLPKISNNILAYNSSGIHRSSGSVTLRNNCVYNPCGYNYSGLSAGTGDISVDPQLLGVGYGEVHLAGGSQCIDTGLDSAVQSGWVDMDGQARLQGSHVDIGADEFTGTAPAFSPRVVRVSPGGNDANDGSSWGSAKLTVQAGIDAVANAGGGDVWVAGGTYNERIALKLWVHVLGGFAGTESSRDERDWTSHVTILDGGGGGSVVSALLGSGMCAVDGFTIRNGTGTAASGGGNGGGVYCISSLPTISNNTITGNTATRGGGIACVAPATILNNVITGNTVIPSTNIDGYGGGIWCGGYGSSAICSATISNNAITGNTSGLSTGSRPGYGGGICCGNYSSAVISNNTIEGNSALVGSFTGIAYGGGIYCDASCSATLVRNTICGNMAQSSGNVGSGLGGGIYCTSGCSAAISNNVITENEAVAGTGGGIYCLSSGAMSNNTIVANKAGRKGGGIYSTSSGAISNNTIAANNAGEGGGIYYDGTSSPALSNNIVAFNSCGIYKGSSGTPVLRNNCFYNPVGYNYSGVSPGTGDISVDPQLVAADYGLVHLAAGSPCIEAGENTVVQAGWVDMDGQARIQGARVDIGADEYDGTAPTFSPRIVRVNSTGDDANDGSSWDLAKRTVQAGIDAASSAGGGEVWVGAGIYNERVSVGRWVHVYGGFGGTETSRDQRDWVVHVTVLDGGAGGAVVSMLDFGMCTVDGFTIRNGTGRVSGTAHWGGGICCGSLATISHNRITGNTALNGAGAGIYCGSAMILNNVISGNGTTSSAVSGGTDGTGGGICCFSPAVIANNTITGNSGNLGGGVYCAGLVAITNNTAVGNVAREGGAIYCGSSSPTISNNILAFNSSGIYRSQGTPTLSHNCVHNPGGYDYSGLSAGDGDISADPGLVAAEYGEFHLAAGSACIDAGSDGAVQTGWLDMDGQARVYGEHVDIGADEFDGTPPVFTPIVVRVSSSGDDTYDGSSWAQAKRTVQAAIDAVSTTAGGEVWVAAGTYNERIVLKPQVYLYGGFAGGESSRAERNWATNVTILDGEAGGSVVSALSGHRVSGIDGFTIRNGTGTSTAMYRYGGGIFCNFSSPVISNNRIKGNVSSPQGYGGGIGCSYASPVVSNNTIEENAAAYDGGGIYCSYSSPAIWNNTIRRNNKGGIHSTSSSPGICNNIITENDEGGINCWYGSARISCNTIVGNTGRNAGGIFNSSGSLVISSNILAFNSSGIYASSGTAVLRNNCVYNPAGYNYSGVSAGTGDISVDPQLVGAEYGELHLAAGSPCIDTGTDSAVESGLDMDGEARIQGGHVDIGADEFNGTAPVFVPAIVRVSPSGDDANDGSSWASAKLTVQAGIDAASLTGGEVWVAAGTYNERIALKAWVHVYGGFEGIEEGRDNRNWAKHVTILDGGAGGTVVTAPPDVALCRVDGFTIRNGSGQNGGGVNCGRTMAVVANSTIVGNTASNGGGIYCVGWSTIVNSAVVGNSAGSGYGGGMYSYWGAPKVINCTFSGNVAASGAGLYNTLPGTPGLINCILWGNNGPTITNSSGTVGAVYCDVEGGWSGTGNINSDPKFVRSPSPGGDGVWGTGDDDYGDVRLLAGSPCIDAGNNAGAVGTGMLVDLDGHARFVNDPATDDCTVAPGTCGTGPIVDMGAYEFVPGDYDRDGDVDLDDLAGFQGCAAGPAVALTGDCAKADFDRDGDVDQADFGVFQRCFGGAGKALGAGCE